MARINLTQAINLIVVENVDGKPSQKTLNLVRGINEVDPSVLVHPYIQSHMKAGSCSIVPDPMDPEDIAAAAEEIARKARAQADAARELKAVEQKKVDDALEAASKPALKTDGPTIAEFVAAGYKVSAYPPFGYASKSTPEEIAAAIAAEADIKAAEDARIQAEAEAAAKKHAEDEEFQRLLHAEAEAKAAADAADQKPAA